MRRNRRIRATRRAVATAGKYWWQKIDNPDAIVKAAARPVQDDRVRYSTALQRAGLFRDEPEIFKGLMDKNVPLALAMRGFDAYYASKVRDTDKKIAGAGFTSREENVARPKREAGGLAATTFEGRVKELENRDKAKRPDSTTGPLGWLADRALDVGQAAQTVGGAVAEGATWAWNRAVAGPLAAGYASDNAADKALNTANDWVDRVPVLGGLASLGLGLVQGAENWGEGIYRGTTGDVSDAQRRDIQQGGLNPDRFGDRVNFYSQDFGEVRAPVTDENIQKIKGMGRWAPDDVDAAREIVTSGAMEDLGRSFTALSPQAQDLILRASNSDKGKNAQELLSEVGDSSQASLGWGILKGFVPESEQQPGQFFAPGSTSRQIASSIVDTIVTWNLDPLVVASKGYAAVRAARWGVAGMPADRVDNTLQMLKASDDAHMPKGTVAKRFDEAMQTADDIAQAGVSTPDAAKLRQSWLRRYPGYDKTLDVLIGQRTGAVGTLRARTMDELKDEAKAAADKARGVQPWVIDVKGDGAPLWRFTKDDGTKLDAEERAGERAKIADELSTFVLLDAMAAGREITGSRLLLPGQLSINGAIRDKIAPVLEAFTRRDASVMKQLKEVGKKPIDLNGHVLADDKGRWEQLVSPDSSEWLRNNYTFGISHMFSRGWRNFERTFSNKVIVPTSPDSPKVFGQLVSQFMPKRQAQMMTTMYAGANPAERWVMTRQTMGSLLNVMNLRNTPEAQKIVDQLTKGLVPEGEYINGYKAGAREYYTTPDNNNIRVGDLKMPAAVHPWQLSEGIELPNWRELRGLANRNWLLNAVTRTADGQTANALVRAWKSSKVTTWSNMFRQGGELGLFTAWRDPAVLKGAREARQAVKADVLTRKVADHDLERLANHVNNLTPDDLHALESVRRSKPEEYVSTVSAMLQRDGFNPGAAEILARLGQDVDLTEYGAMLASKSESRVRRLAMLGPVDRLRRVRAERAARKGGAVGDSPLSEYLDGEMAADMLQAAAKGFGSAADSYAWTMAERATHADRKRITDAAGRNVSFRPVKIVNGYEWADTNPQLWAAELGRRQADPTGDLVMRWIAHRHLVPVDERARSVQNAPLSHEDQVVQAVRQIEQRAGSKTGADYHSLKDVRDLLPGLTRAEVDVALKNLSGKNGVNIVGEAMQRSLTDDQRAAAIKLGGTDRHNILVPAAAGNPKAAVAPTHAPDLDQLAIDNLSKLYPDGLPVDPARLGSPDNLMAHLYAEHELGASMRSNGAALQYLPNGKPVVSHADRIVAAETAAKRAVDDLVHHMGGKVQRSGDSVSIHFPDEVEPLLRKLADGKELSAAELGKLPADVRPEGMVAPIYAPMIPEKQGFTHGLSNLATRAYGAVVAEPLDKLFMMPAFVAQRRLAQDELAPLMSALVDKGMSEGQAAHLLEATVNNRAVSRVFMGTDNPIEKSVFSEMADKWLMFQRAQEDFLRRLISATKAHPEGLARANILMQAGVHTGIVHYEPYQDEEGNTEYHLTFAYPGTALAQRVMADAAVGLGLAPDELLRVPQFDGLKSQVRFLNPGFSNPLQFSANPIFGLSMTAAEKLWPSATVDLERLKRGFSGGSDFEGTDGPLAWRNLLPSAFSRFSVFASQDDADGQFQSAMRAALMYAEAAGQTPGPDASPAERSRYLDGVKATATNIMLQRAVFGTFLPAAPQVADPNDVELDAVARAQHLPNLRSEFFEIRNEMSRVYPDNFFRADSEAVAEFARRYPGELIVNPAAFSTGSTKVAGAEEGFAPYTIAATKWLLDNKQFVQDNPTVAIALMPKDTSNGDFSNEAYKLQLKSDVRTHKSIEEFYNDVTLSDDISEYYDTRSRYFTAAKSEPSVAKSVYAKMDDWEDGWRRSHPLASAELNRRSNPDFVHSEIAPSLQRMADGTDPLPQSLTELRPQINTMWSDYQSYRQRYMKVDYYNNAGRATTNKQYQHAGDVKWLETPLAGLWNLMRVTEGR